MLLVLRNENSRAWIGAACRFVLFEDQYLRLQPGLVGGSRGLSLRSRHRRNIHRWMRRERAQGGAVCTSSGLMDS